MLKVSIKFKYDPSNTIKHNKQIPVMKINIKYNSESIRFVVTLMNWKLTSLSISEEKACTMHLPHKELQADDGVDDDHKEYKQGDVQQWNHGLNYGVQHYL